LLWKQANGESREKIEQHFVIHLCFLVVQDRRQLIGPWFAFHSLFLISLSLPRTIPDVGATTSTQAAQWTTKVIVALLLCFFRTHTFTHPCLDSLLLSMLAQQTSPYYWMMINYW
jgi:hypothetical protein